MPWENPENGIYTPFKALMDNDIEAIKKRNIEYARFYNHGDFSPQKVEERLESDEVKYYFNVIKNM